MVTNQEIHRDFAGLINKEKLHEIHLFSCVDRICKHPSAESFDNANASNVKKILDNCSKIR